MFEIAEAKPAICFGNGNSVQPERTHLGPQLDGKAVLCVYCGGERRDSIGGKSRRRLADHVGGLAQRKVEIGHRKHSIKRGYRRSVMIARVSAW